MKMTIFQINPDKAKAGASSTAVDSGYVDLARLEDTPAGWGDYPTIRAYFLGNEIDDESLYGFFSSDFFKRTGLASTAVSGFIDKNPGRDVYTFFPFIHDSACFANVFEQGELTFPGMAAATQAYLASIELAVSLDDLVTDFSDTVHSNYVVAKPIFWRTWFGLTEKIFDIAESADDPLALKLNAASEDAALPAMKQALADRMASLVLALDGELTIAPFDITQMPCSNSAYLRYWDSMLLLDASKQAFRRTGNQQHLTGFFTLRDKILQACEPRFERRADADTDADFKADAQADTKADTWRFTAPPQTDLIYGCITHVPLPIKFPDFVLPVYLGESQGPDRMNLREWAPEWEPYHPIVGGQVGNFALKNYILKHHPDIKRIGVCMYRKFVSRRRISGVPAEDNWMMDVISDADFQKESIDSMMSPGDQAFLIGQTCGFSVHGAAAGYLLHYSHAHHADDLLRFTSEAVELGVLEGTEVTSFFDEKVFLMGGIELGVFPADFWLATVSAIESVIWACVHRYPVQREGYQTRAWAFCAERLGSYLLLKHLKAQNSQNGGGYEQFFGQLNLITENDAKLYVPSN